MMAMSVASKNYHITLTGLPLLVTFVLAWPVFFFLFLLGLPRLRTLADSRVNTRASPSSAAEHKYLVHLPHNLRCPAARKWRPRRTTKRGRRIGRVLLPVASLCSAPSSMALISASSVACRPCAASWRCVPLSPTLSLLLIFFLSPFPNSPLFYRL